MRDAGTTAGTGKKAGKGAMALLALLLIACGHPEEPAPGTPLRFGMDLWPGYFPAVLAEQQGFMAAEGVDLDVVPSSDTNALMADFAAGRFDLIAVSLGDGITLSRSRPDVMVLLVADESAGGDQLLRAPGLAADAPPPHRYGTNLGGFGELFIRAFLQREGIPPQQALWVDLDSSEVPKALSEGRIDYGHTWQPYASEAAALGAVPVFSSAETPELIVDVVLTTRATLERKPEALRGFTRAWFRAAEQWQASPAEGNALAERALGLAPSSASLEGICLYSLADNRRVMAGGAAAPLALLIDRYASFFVERSNLSAPPKAESMFDPALLPEAGSMRP